MVIGKDLTGKVVQTGGAKLLILILQMESKGITMHSDRS
jgi:hypothetical protein